MILHFYPEKGDAVAAAATVVAAAEIAAVVVASVIGSGFLGQGAVVGPVVVDSLLYPAEGKQHEGMTLEQWQFVRSAVLKSCWKTSWIQKVLQRSTIRSEDITQAFVANVAAAFDVGDKVKLVG